MCSAIVHRLRVCGIFFFTMFGVGSSLVSSILSIRCKSRVYNLCFAMCLYIIREIWRITNSTSFGNGRVSLLRVTITKTSRIGDSPNFSDNRQT